MKQMRRCRSSGRQVTGKWIFEGKILLNDFYRITGLEDDPFEEVRGDSETLAGLLLELLEEIPVKGREITRQAALNLLLRA
jgi:putative hemolysin